MGHHLKDYTLTDEWVDICSLPDYSEVSGKLTTVQAQWTKVANVWLGGAAKPSGTNTGSFLRTGSAITQTSDHWWLKGQGIVSILIEE